MAYADYGITVSIEDATKKNQVETILSHIESTPEGVFLLNRIKLYAEAITIQDGNDGSHYCDNEAAPQCAGNLKTIELDWNQISTTMIRSREDDEFRYLSLNRTLVHELFHAADVHAPGIDLKGQQGKAIHFANEFMSKYYSENSRYSNDITNQGIINTVFDKPKNLVFYNDKKPNGDYKFKGWGMDSMTEIFFEPDDPNDKSWWDELFSFLYLDESKEHYGLYSFFESNPNPEERYNIVHGDDNDEIINTISTGSGNSIVFAAKGNDLIYSRGGKNILVGREGNDTVSYFHSTTSVNVDLISGNMISGINIDSYKVDKLDSIENIVGSNYDDIILGNEFDNIISGGDGEDFIDGDEGADTALYEDLSTNYDFIKTDRNPRIKELSSGDKDYLENMERIEFTDTTYVWKDNLGRWDNGTPVNTSPVQMFQIPSIVVTQGLSDTSGLDLDRYFYDAEDDDNLTFTKVLNEGEPPTPWISVGVNGAVTVDAPIEPYGEWHGTPPYTTTEPIIVPHFGTWIYEVAVSDGQLGNKTKILVRVDPDPEIFEPTYDHRWMDGTGEDELIEIDAGHELTNGAGGDDTIIGQWGYNTILGGSGHDVIAGSLNQATGDAFYADLYFGDNGNDTIYADGGQDTAYGGDGRDSLIGSTGSEYLNGNLHDDYIDGGRGSDTLFGESGRDTLIGGDGRDTLDGGAGDDTLEDQSGENVIFGGLGNDVIIISDSTSNTELTRNTIDGGEGFDKIDLTGIATEDGFEVNLVENNFGFNSGYLSLGNIFRVEHITTGDYDDELYGDLAGNVLIAKGGDDTLNGDRGDDDLYGGDGNDFLQGGMGHDYLDGGDGNDSANYGASSGGAIEVDLAVNYARDNWGDEDELVNIETVYGSAYNDRIYGNDEDNNLSGSDGDDTINARGGFDEITGGNGNDRFVVNAFANSHDRIWDFTQGEDKIDLSNTGYLYSSINNLTLSQGSLLNFDTTIISMASNQIIEIVGVLPTELTDSDFIFTVDGLFGMGLDDNKSVNSNDFGSSFAVKMAEGFDTLTVKGASSIVAGDFAQTEELERLEFDNSTHSVQLSDALVADADGNHMEIDFSGVTSSSNGSVLDGSLVTSGTLDVTGGSGNDSLTGGALEDHFTDSAGDDSYTGGNGADIFAFSLQANTDDVITDFTQGEDVIDFSDSSLSAIAAITDLTITQNGADTVIDLGNNQTITLSNITATSLTESDFVFDRPNLAPQLARVLDSQLMTEDTSLYFTLDESSFIDPEGDVITYSATLDDDSALPSWLTFDANTQSFAALTSVGDAGEYSVKVTATDSAGNSTSEFFSLTVQQRPENIAPTVVTPIDDITIDDNTALSLNVTDHFADSDGEFVFFSAQLDDGSPLPSWISFNAGTGEFSGMPASSDVGTVTIAVTAHDFAGDSVTEDFVLTVTPINDAPEVTNLANQGAVAGTAFSYVIAAESFYDDEGDSLTLTATLADDSALPSWLVFDAATRTFSGTPASGDIGIISVKVIADDGNGGIGSEVFDLEVFATGTILGTPETEQIDGTSSGEVIVSLSGNDTIYGNGGNDTLYGGDDADTLIGGTQDDVLYGGAGNDTYAFATIDGEDTLNDSSGADRIFLFEDQLLMMGNATASTVSGWEYEMQFGNGNIAYFNWEGDPNVQGSRGDLEVDFDATFYYDIIIENFASGEFGISLEGALEDEDPEEQAGVDPMNFLFSTPTEENFNKVDAATAGVEVDVWEIDPEAPATASVATLDPETTNQGSSPTVIVAVNEDDDLVSVGIPTSISNSNNTVNNFDLLIAADPVAVDNGNEFALPASNIGDPHLLTFDGLFYDFQDTGEFTLVQSTDTNSFTVQARMREWNLGDAVGDKFSVNTAIATQMGAHKVGFYIPGSLPYDPADYGLDDSAFTNEIPALYIDDQAHIIPDNGVILVDAGYIHRQGDSYTVINGFGDRFTVTIHDKYIDFVSYASSQRAANTLEGLLGNYDGDTTNEYKLDDGTDLGSSISVATLYDVFGEDWRITQGESLFLYGEGENTSSFDNPDFENVHRTLADFDPALVSAAESAAIAEGFDPTSAVFDAVVLDFLVMGFVEYSETWQILEEQSANVVDAEITAYDGNVIEGTVASEAITGTPEEDYILAHEGNDTIYGQADDDTIVGGAGDDIIYGEAGIDTYIHNVGDGNDHIFSGEYLSLDQLVMNGVANEDLFIRPDPSNSYNLLVTDKNTGETVTIANQYYSTGKTMALVNGIDVRAGLEINATDASEVIWGTAYADTIRGGLGNDTIHGKTGVDVYIHNEGDGNDLLYSGEANSSDSIIMNDAFGNQLAPEDITFEKNSWDLLVINRNSGESITITNQFAYTGKYIASVNGIDITAGLNFIGTGASESVKATGYSDTIEGGLGDDTLYGYTGADTYIHNQGDGNDIIYSGEANSSDTIIMKDDGGNLLTQDELQFVKSSLNLLVINRESGETITIVDQFAFSGKTIASVNGINITGGLNLLGTDAAEEISGSNYGDTLEGGLGDDTLKGNGGADFYIHNQGDGNDILQSGEVNSLDVISMRDSNGVELAATEITFVQSGWDLIATNINSNETLTLQNMYYSTGHAFDYLNGIDLDTVI